MQKTIIYYNKNLKQPARHLRKNMTESECRLWSRLRYKQVLGVQFYRQRPIGNYVTDFFAPRVGLVIEVDGSQHRLDQHAAEDRRRDGYLIGLGLQVLRFNSREVLEETDSVVERIFQSVEQRIGRENPPVSPFAKGGGK